MAFGFLKKIGKGLLGGVKGFITGGPLAAIGGTVAGFTSSDHSLEPPPSYQPPPAALWEPPPIPPPAQLPYFSYSGGGVGSGPVNTFDPPKMNGLNGPTRPNGAPKTVFAKPTQKKKVLGRARKRVTRAPKKPKFGSPAFRKKYLSGKKKK